MIIRKINHVNYEQEFVGGFDGSDFSDRKNRVSNMASILSNNLFHSCFVSYGNMNLKQFESE